MNETDVSNRSLAGRHDNPAAPTRSPRDYRMPVDLTRSRRVGLSVTVCANCAAKKDQGRCFHARWCEAPGEWMRLTTGPLRPDQTSKDVGWSWGALIWD